MRFTLSEDQSLLADAVGSALEDACPPDRVRAAWGTPDDELWSLLAELGVLGLTAPEDLGGMGMAAVEAAAICREMGQRGVPGPLVEHLALLPVLADSPYASQVETAIQARSRITCAPKSAPVPDAERADVVVRVDGPSVLIVESPECAPLRSVDGSRRVFSVRGSVVPIHASGESLHDHAAVYTAATLLGLAQRMLDMAVAYAKDRRQFGKPIGTFQAVQHHLANALLALKFAEPAVMRAAWGLSTGHPDASLDVCAAKALASDAASEVARAALQVHGAIGYTIECDLQLFHKRILALRSSWGDADWHRDRAADLLQLP